MQIVVNGISIIEILTILISIISFYISITTFKTERLKSIYHDLFHDILLNEFPKAFTSYLENKNKENFENFLSILWNLIDKIVFFQFYNGAIYKELKGILEKIDECFELFAQSNNPIYISQITELMKRLYDTIYELKLLKSIKYACLNKVKK